MSNRQPPDLWFEMVTDLACESSLDGHLTRVNGSWERCMGYSADELMGRPYLQFIHIEDRRRTAAAARTLARAPTDIVNFENRFQTKDGDWRWLLWSARSEGSAIYAIAKDITDRKLREDTLEELLARVESIARTDELTGLANRRALDEELDCELNRAARVGYEVSVAILDIDNFKAYNDRHGHSAGDVLLREAAAAWRMAIRAVDFIARYGGEEFVVILPACSRPSAADVIQRLRAAMPNDQTVSGGIASWNRSESGEALLIRADQALYASKRAGRNCLIEADANGRMHHDGFLVNAEGELDATRRGLRR